MKKQKPATLRRRQDEELIKRMIADSDGATPYNDGLNPFDAGTLRFERFKRLYERYRRTWLDTDARFRELCEVYGMDLGKGF